MDVFAGLTQYYFEWAPISITKKALTFWFGTDFKK